MEVGSVDEMEEEAKLIAKYYVIKNKLLSTVWTLE